MRNIKLSIEYDGTRYAGWEKSSMNSKDISVSGKIEEVLEKMENKEVTLIGAMRTEAGAHAIRQIANFHTDSKKSLVEIKQYLRRYLPQDIAVSDVEEADDRFHAAFSAKSFVFEYHISVGDVPSVFERRYKYYCFKKPDVDKMRQAAEKLVGKNDLKSFSDNRKMKKNTVREIKNIDIYGDSEEILITLEADDFWPNMARNIVGLLIAAGHSEITSDAVSEIIESGDRNKVPMAPEPKGLFLADVVY